MSAGTNTQAQSLLFWTDGSLQGATVSKPTYTANYFLFWSDGQAAGTVYPTSNSNNTYNFFFFLGGI